MIKLIFSIVISFITILNIAYSEEKQIQKFEISISGNKRLSDKFIKSLIDIDYKKNEQNRKDEIIKDLYKTKLFSDIDIFQNEKTLHIKLKENPLIKEIIFKGNDKIDDDILLSEISLSNNTLFNKASLKKDILKIYDIYKETGRINSEIKEKIEYDIYNRITLTFEISEGEVAKIKEINFIGNNSFKDKNLISELFTKKSKWYHFFSSKNFYNENFIKYDIEKLKNFYNSRGYPNFSVTSAISIFSLKDNLISINYIIEEGKKFTFGKTKLINNFEKINDDKINKIIDLKEGKIYNHLLVEDNVKNISKIISKEGFPFIEVKENLKLNEETQEVDIDFTINKSIPIYINQILIKGNNRTLTEVIRRELLIKEGDPYILKNLTLSQQRLTNLGFFENVNFDIKRNKNQNSINIIINIKERKTGELSFGIGYSSLSRLTGNISLRERNLFGTGNILELNLNKSSSYSNNTIGYTKPYFLNRNLDLGFEIFDLKLNKLDNLVYDRSSRGFSLKASYLVKNYIRHQIRYSFKKEKITDINDNASILIKELEGKFTNHIIGHSINIENIDNRFNPKKGYIISFSQDYSGLIGDNKYLKNKLIGSYYLPILENKFIFKILGNFGYIDGLGENVKTSDNFFLGGHIFRGFEYGGLGPRSSVDGNYKNGETIGGKLYYMGSIELGFPNFLPKDLNMDTALFFDIGTLTNVDNIGNSKIIDIGSLRSSAGISLRWRSPLGPIKLDFSRAIKYEYFDQTENFNFNMGTIF